MVFSPPPEYQSSAEFKKCSIKGLSRFSNHNSPETLACLLHSRCQKQRFWWTNFGQTVSVSASLKESPVSHYFDKVPHWFTHFGLSKSFFSLNLSQHVLWRTQGAVLHQNKKSFNCLGHWTFNWFSESWNGAKFLRLYLTFLTFTVLSVHMFQLDCSIKICAFFWTKLYRKT